MGRRRFRDGRMRPTMLMLSTLVLLVGLGFVAWPAVMELVSSTQAKESISAISTVYDSMSDAARQENIAQAHAFNDRLLGIRDAGNIWDYDMQLTYHEEPSTMMAWIEIPKIGTCLPIYHHATEAILMTGVGHLNTTCLPVGGEGTLCALSGHSGMQNARMFDDIRNLEVGDRFVIWTLNEPYAYSVCDIRVVDPDDTSLLQPQPRRDLVALVTCTPINVNSHRLVVLAERCEYDPQSERLAEGMEAVANRRTLPIIVASLAVAAVLAGLAIAGAVAMARKGKGGGHGVDRQ